MPVCPQCGHENAEHARFCSSCGAVIEQAPAAADPLIGVVVADRYRIVRAIGEGGMGRVYLAEQRMGTAIRAVALKVLTTSVYDSLSVARFHRECETVIQLTHPNTIRFYDFGRIEIPLPSGGVDPRLYIAMEHVDGRSLAKAIEDGPMPVGIVDRLVRQIGGALTEAHRRGIVHRDLKPDNVLLARDEIEGVEFPKVCDFGIAKKDQAGGPEITAQGTIIGTPAYMSPEQITGLPVDERSDVYALALMTYEMLTGVRPFVARTPIEWATAHMTAAPRPFEEFPATRSLAIEKRAAILRALEKDARDRTPTVRRFVEELCGLEPRTSEPALPPTNPHAERAERDEIAEGATIAATPQAISRTGAPVPVPTSALGPTLVALAALGLVGAGAATVWMFASAPEAPPIDGAGDAGPSDAAVDAGDPTMPHEWSQILQLEERVEEGTLALGPPDGRCARIAPGGTVHVELAPGVRMSTDGTAAPDVRVIILEGSVPYRLDVGVERRQFTTIAQGVIASTPLDVDQFGISRFRYVRVKNRAARGHVCVDAIGTYAHPTP
jgi:serine/threonine protein kinase